MTRNEVDILHDDEDTKSNSFHFLDKGKKCALSESPNNNDIKKHRVNIEQPDVEMINDEKLL